MLNHSKVSGYKEIEGGDYVCTLICWDQTVCVCVWMYEREGVCDYSNVECMCMCVYVCVCVCMCVCVHVYVCVCVLAVQYA